MSSYYIPMVQPLSELNRDELKQYPIYAAAFEHGQKLIFEEFQPALKLATNEIGEQTKGQFFLDWRPVIPGVALVAMCKEGVITSDAHPLNETEKIGLGIARPAAVFFGEPNAGSVTAVSAFFENDVLHDQYGVSARVQSQGEVNLSVIAEIAARRITALDLLSDAIYRMPAEERVPFANEITAQLCRFSKTNESDSLRMVLGTEPMDIKAGLPTTELFASMVGISAKSLKGFAQDAPLGLDFGMRLLQRADKQLSWELGADTLAKIHDMHYMYGQALSQSATRDQLACVNALSSAMLQWSWKLDRDTDAIIENIDALGIIADEIKREMERPADKAFTAMIQAVPQSEQCEFRAHLMQCPNVQLAALMFSTDMHEIHVGVTLACEYAAQETDVSEETREALYNIINEQFPAVQPALTQSADIHEELAPSYDFAEDTELADQYNEDVIDNP